MGETAREEVCRLICGDNKIGVGGGVKISLGMVVRTRVVGGRVGGSLVYATVGFMSWWLKILWVSRGGLGMWVRGEVTGGVEIHM